MHDHTYKPGDRVFVVTHHGVPTRLTTVTAVKVYKRDTKVTTKHGDWSAYNGHPWANRSTTWYTGANLMPYTEALAAKFKSRQREATLRWCLDHWTELTPEQQAYLAGAVKTVRAEHPKG